ncbi:TPA: acyltransferase [Photobacterium damselae]
MELGIDYHIGRKTVLELSNNSNFYLKGKVKIMNGCLVSLYENATVTIGNNTFLNENSKIISEDNIFIGNDCAISWSVTIMDTDLHDIYINNVKKERKKTIFIGNNVLIGANASILKGAQVQSFSIVSFGTIVRSNSDLYNTIHFNDKSISFRELKWK